MHGSDDFKMGFIAVAGLILVAALGIACGGGGGTSGTSNVTSINDNTVLIHTNASSYDSAECVKCHGNMMTQETLDKKIEGIHPKHITATGLVCTDCHKNVDILGKSGANLRRQVDVQKCVDCHGTIFYQGA